MPLGVGLAQFGWYAMPDYVPSKMLRGVIKTGLAGGCVAYAMTRLTSCSSSQQESSDCSAERTVDAGGATGFDDDDEAIGATPDGREVLGVLRDHKTFAQGGKCGCGGRGGCRSQERESADELKTCEESSRAPKWCRTVATYLPDDIKDRLLAALPSEPNRADVAGAALSTVAVVVEQSLVYRLGEAMSARGIRCAHTKQAALLGVLSAGVVTVGRHLARVQ